MGNTRSNLKTQLVSIATAYRKNFFVIVWAVAAVVFFLGTRFQFGASEIQVMPSIRSLIGAIPSITAQELVSDTRLILPLLLLSLIPTYILSSVWLSLVGALNVAGLGSLVASSFQIASSGARWYLATAYVIDLLLLMMLHLLLFVMIAEMSDFYGQNRSRVHWWTFFVTWFASLKHTYLRYWQLFWGILILRVIFSILINI